jgi:hypothetical protein
VHVIGVFLGEKLAAGKTCGTRVERVACGKLAMRKLWVKDLVGCPHEPKKVSTETAQAAIDRDGLTASRMPL